jgi:CRISPR-associated protein Csd1
MILHALHELYDRLKVDPSYQLAPPDYSLQKITFKVVLRPDGERAAIDDVRRVVDGRAMPRQVRVLGGTKSSGSGLNPCFLWDNSGYMLGFKPDDPDPDRTRKTFEAFRDLHLAREEAVNVPEFSAVCRFLQAWDPSHGSAYPALVEAATTGFGVFQIQGQSRWVHEHPRIDEWWRNHGSDEEDKTFGQCLVTGSEAPLARTHDRVRGVAGAQGAGGAIVGFNDTAYQSYGKRQSFNAPVSSAAAFRYVAALNALLDGPKKRRHRMLLSDTTIAFWTDRPDPIEDIFLEVIGYGSDAPARVETQDEGQRQRVELLLEAIRQGRPGHPELAPDPESTQVFLLGLSPNSARISVRFFHQGSVADLVRRVHRHQCDIGLDPQPPTKRWKGDPELPSIRSLLDQTARERKDVPSVLEGALLQSIIRGTPYPHALFAAVIRRIHADRSINYLRCCILKGYLTRNLNLEVSMALDSDRADPAYRLGRLFAALEKTQRDALGENLNKTIRDGFYSSASATPGSVFPRLLRTYQHHLAKLEGGRRVNRERLVQDILAPMDGFPGQLSLADQGLFAIGYYHQTRDFYTRRANGEDADGQGDSE